ncbi:uncharacterized protein LOC130997796 [Salvia miltiorrhiza]|uniref:uncharacterized protein LOC130997796 n=1 Tax=Salvia miltiorrhiza TaxID=226208 RepID=UPI0025AC581E|nr:uncharacterized protein LOC130997796 [Salvia miltiorrhiza]
MYYLSTVGIYMGAQYNEGQNQDFQDIPIQGEEPEQEYEVPLHDTIVQEEEVSLHDIPIHAHDLPATGMDRRARSSSSRGGGSRGRAREKRVRPPTTSSSSSSGDHSNRPVDRAYLDATVRRMEEAHEERLKRHSESIEARVKRTLKEFLVELKGFLSCKSVQARDVHSPAPRPTPASETRHFDDIRDEGAEESDVPRDDNVTQSPYVPQFTQFECGSTSFLGTDAEIPRFSNPIDQMRACFDYMGEEMVSFGEPSQRIEAPVLPRRSTRQRFPSQQLESPYAASGEPRLVSTKELDNFRSFLNGNDSGATVLESNHKLSKNWFKSILKPDASLHQDVLELFILSLQSKLMHRVSLLPFVKPDNTMISSFDLYRVCEQYWGRCFFSTRLNHVIPGSYESFHDWVVPQSIISMIQGVNGSSTAQNWFGATQIVVPCRIKAHYVVVRICPGPWETELHDPLFYGMDDIRKKERVAEIQSLLSLFGKILEDAGYWTLNVYGWERKTCPLTLYIPGPDEQFSQKDTVSSGPFACMVMERVLSDSPSITWGNTRVKKYREIIAASAFSMCVID